MASEYLKWKARDEKPAPPPPEMTKKEKVLNWLHYHKLHLAAAAFVLWIAGSMLWNVLGIGKTKPDVIVAYIGRDTLREEAAGSLEAALTPFCEDRNGDGKQTLELRQYALDRSGELETALYYNYAADTTLVADITAGESYLFLAEDPQAVQRAYQIFARADGSPPAEDDYEVWDKVFRWGDCPALRGADPALENLFLGRRCFFDEKQAAAQAGNEGFWQRLTEGATR